MLGALRRPRTSPGLTAPQLDRYEALLGESDQDLLAWISGQAPVPARHDHDVFHLLRELPLGRPRGLTRSCPTCPLPAPAPRVAESAIDLLAERAGCGARRGA